MSDFVGDRQCVTHHACECIMARANTAEQLESRAFHTQKALQWAIEWIEKCAEIPVPGDEQEEWEAWHSAKELAEWPLAASVSKEEARPTHRDLKAVEELHDFETRRTEALLELARRRGIDEPSIASALADAEEARDA